MTGGLPGTTLPGGLRLLDQLSLTPEGPLYRAQLPDGRELVVLLLQPDQLGGDPAVRTHLRDWYRQALRIRHPNVAAVRDVGETETGQIYVVSECLTGELLSELLASSGALAPADAMRIYRQVVSGLQAAHRVGWTHGNLSPDTILLTQTPDGTSGVKLIHFTLPFAPAEAGADRADNLIAGREYASPERLAGQPPTEAGDVFSLGAVLHHLLTGAPPGSKARKATIPRAMRAVIGRALAPVPAQRFRTIAELAAAVEAAVTAAAEAERRRASAGGPGPLRVAAAVVAVVATGVWLRGSLEQPVESALLRVSEAASTPPPPKPPVAPSPIRPSAPAKHETKPPIPPPAPRRTRAAERAPERAAEPPPVSPRAADSAVSSPDTGQGGAREDAREDAPRTLDQRAQVYLRIGLDEAARQLGGPVHGIEGMSPVFIGLAQRPLLAGADSIQPVVRAVYLDPNGRLILLDQQRISARASVPKATGDRWPIGSVMMYLHGETSPQTIRNLRARVR
ncbi:MAG TPA: serine/threonine-protein kinase [Gemmatimonadales bacterium]|jgi:serine/threonine-protein kinase|nr:serine/threonine-protein kinase [Gemmatimonadales bacterium]